ncbi:NADH-quinone oxidoreductase subunit A [Fimbriimonas ginsengisoli]|uniref:NADH-quinone oxidoreductase subunit A n=1 Tax=Fimbriimonas ginsengisoli Gsoil 348 TaxID=661478 RepID=A0A068NTV6_FIMGI|nr:NADH-quinone oxidoreductase subunit A [Fimbriimonas ginsengisoli]AIE86797.1 NADH-ubiquinone/plastoquinone oxidoreductase subunit 3 [Fimbriimonas ginsengisoli Gsoil 348]
MNDAYVGILVLMGVAAALAGVLVTASWILGPKKQTPYKSAPYECGVAPVGDAHERFPIKFYLVAIVFILFDIEAVFLWGFYTAYKNAPANDNQFVIYAFFEFLTYMATWILGYVYAIRVGAIDWDESSTLAPEKMLSRRGTTTTDVAVPESTLVGAGGGTK